MTQRLKIASALSAAALFAGAAHANIVTNGGFETGTFAGWTQFGDTSFTFVSNEAPAVQAGTFGAAFGPVDAGGGISQNLATVAGTSYLVSFWLANLGGGTNSFNFDWDGGADELVLVNAPVSAFTQYAYTLVASSNSTSLNFAFTNPPSFWVLDSISVTATVPTPGSLALAGLALVGAGLATRARKNA